MSIEWNDLYVRTAVGETGPDDRAGGLGSPDIIPTGITPVDPTTFTTAVSYYTYYNLPFEGGKPNYVYVRAKNASKDGPNAGEAYLDMSDPAIVLWPGGDKWTRLKTSNSDQYNSPLSPDPVGKQAIGVTTDPFVFVPGPNDTGHRCLVTWLSTQQHPNPGPPPKITSIDELVKFLKNNPAYAHHNIDITANTTGAVTQKQPYSSGTLEAVWSFGIQCEGAAGFMVSFSSATQIGGKYVVLKPSTVVQNEKYTITVDDITVPANIDTYFNYTYQQMGIQPTQPFSITFVAFYKPPQNHPLWREAHTADHYGIAPGSVSANWRGIQVGSIGLMKGVTP